MPRERTDPVENERGEETHPAFGMISVHRISATPGEVLFQSDLRHREYMVLEVSEASRKRDLKHDWVHPHKTVLKVSMSMAQFASFVASAGTTGVPCTIEYTGTGSNEPGMRPGLSPQPRLAVTSAEVRSSAFEAFEHIMTAFERYQESLSVEGKGSAAARRSALAGLRAAIANAAPNVSYAAQRLGEHAEAVVEKSRADVEAMVTRMAERAGLSADQVKGITGGEQ